MTTTNQSDLQKAVDGVKPNDLAENLDPKNTPTEIPETLNKDQTTPFIDESVRTDK